MTTRPGRVLAVVLFCLSALPVACAYSEDVNSLTAGARRGDDDEEPPLDDPADSEDGSADNDAGKGDGSALNDLSKNDGSTNDGSTSGPKDSGISDSGSGKDASDPPTVKDGSADAAPNPPNPPDSGSGGNVGFGGACRSNGECKSNLCTTRSASPSSDTGYCTVPCERDKDCRNIPGARECSRRDYCTKR